jgi:hypothetical protein
MKKALLSITFLIAGGFSLLAQGTVQFDNGDWNFADASTVDRFVYADSVGGTLLDNATYQAGLFELRSGNYVQLGDLCSFDFGGATIPGVWAWDGADRTLSVANGVDTTLQVRIFDGAGSLLASSADFTFRNANNSPPAPTDPLMINFRAFAVPEPSTIALGVLGLGALLLFRRRQ